MGLTATTQEEEERAKAMELAHVGGFIPPTLTAAFDAFRNCLPEAAKRAATSADTAVDTLAEPLGALNYFRSRLIRWHRATWKSFFGAEPELEADDPKAFFAAPADWVESARQLLRKANE